MLEPMWTIDLPDEAATRALGRALGACADGPVVVALVGDLGAGKTAFAQGVGEGLQVAEAVVSPTFVLVSEYDGRLPLLHADVYRLEADELDAVGLEEQVEGWPGVALIEWADRFPHLVPEAHVVVRIGIVGDARRATVAAGGAAATVVARWQAAHGA